MNPHRCRDGAALLVAGLFVVLSLPGCGSDDGDGDEGDSNEAKVDPCKDPKNPKRYRATFGGTGQDNGFGVAITSDGGTVMVGSNASGGPASAWVVSVDEQGATRWAKSLKAKVAKVVTASGTDALVVDDDVTGTLIGVDGKDKWSRSWATKLPADGFETPHAAIASGKGFVVVGTRYTTKHEKAKRKGRIWKIGENGLEVWSRTIGSDGKNTCEGLVERADGDIITAGFSAAVVSGEGRQVWVHAADKDGEKLWEQRHGGPLDDEGHSVVTAGDGYLVAATTRSKGAGEADLWMLRLDKQGNLLWDQTYGGEGSDEPRAMGGLSDGSVIVVGRHTSEQTLPGGVWLLRIDSEGKLLWEATYGRAWKAEGTAIAIANDEYAAIGSTELNGAGSDDFWLLRGGEDGKPWCSGNTGAPCKGAGAEPCHAGLTCDVDMKPPMCQQP